MYKYYLKYTYQLTAPDKKRGVCTIFTYASDILRSRRFRNGIFFVGAGARFLLWSVFGSYIERRMELGTFWNCLAHILCVWFASVSSFEERAATRR